MAAPTLTNVVTQELLEVAGHSDPNTRITQIADEVLTSNAARFARVSQELLEVAGHSSPSARLTQVCVEVLVKRGRRRGFMSLY